MKSHNKSYRAILCLTLTVVFSVSCAAQLAGPVEIQAPVRSGSFSVVTPPPPAATNLIHIEPDHADWTYALGENPTFHVSLAVRPFPEAGIPITYRIGPEQFEGSELAAVVPAGGLDIPAGASSEPGFTRVIVTTTFGGETNRAISTVGFAPELISPTQTEPADFDAFWAEQRSALAAIPPEPELTPMPELSTPAVEVFHWSIQNVGNWMGPSRMYGILAVPRGPGPFPAVMQAPGAGVRAYKGQVDLASRGVITLEIGIHGMPVNLDTNIYLKLVRAGLNNYQFSSIEDRNSYFYRRVYLGCLRANDYLTSHPKWDGKTLIATGYSQGGMLAIVTAALDPRVTGVAASYPAFCDVTGYLHGRAGGWPGLFRPDIDGTLQVLPPGEPRLVTTTYYDVVNFARRLHVPGCYGFGYNDDVCPPTSMFAMYNVITAPKELVISPEQGHHLSAPQRDRRADWLDARLGLE